MDEDDEEEPEKPKGMTVLPHNAHWYIAFRAAEIFYEKNSRYPGQFSRHTEQDLANDVLNLTKCAKELLSDWGLDAASVLIPQTLEEMYVLLDFVAETFANWSGFC
jgi:hypothetical protein